MVLTWTHSALKPPGAKNCKDILEKSDKLKSKWWPCFSSSLMKRVLNFMRNPKLAHILDYVWYVELQLGTLNYFLTASTFPSFRNWKRSKLPVLVPNYPKRCSHVEVRFSMLGQHSHDSTTTQCKGSVQKCQGNPIRVGTPAGQETICRTQY